MAVTHSRYTVGTTLARVVADSPDSQEVWLQNLAPENTVEAYAKEGKAYLVQREFAVSSPGTVIFDVETGTNGLQIQGYDIVSDTDKVKAELIEGATVGTTGSAIQAYNMNRNFSDAHDAVLLAGTSISGGTTIAAEFITADKHAASGGSTSGKIFTLEPSTHYAMKFVNRGNQTTNVHFQLRFVEDFNGHTDIWVGDAVGTGVRVRGGETVHMSLIQGQTLSAVSEQDNELMVTRQD